VFVWMHVDETPALWVVSSAAALDPIENEYVNLLRVVTGQWGARIVPAGAVVPFDCACVFFPSELPWRLLCFQLNERD
jgi:hypothetical protein